MTAGTAICFIVEDIEATRGGVIAQQGEPLAPTTLAKVSFNLGSREIGYRAFTVHDPDGVAVDFVNQLVMEPGAIPRANTYSN